MFMKKYKKSIFWFRQDLRLEDNTGLQKCLEHSKEILPIFVLDTHIICKFWWLSDAKFWFIREALEYLSKDLAKIWLEKVIVFHDAPEQIIPQLVKHYDIEAIFCNTSYGSYGKKRDEAVEKSVWIPLESYKDFLIAEPDEIEQRKVFTPYYKLWQKYIIQNCPIIPSNSDFLSARGENIVQVKIEEQTEAKDFIELEKHPYFTMEFWKERFAKLPLQNYDDTRNSLDVDGTSRLSPYLRFGVFSARQILGKVLEATNWELPPKWTHTESYVSELAWREFWWQIFYNFPETKTTEFQEKRRYIPWSQDKKMFQKWCDGETGYPIVDAAMKQLNETNWMHGRARMIVSSFLTKDLQIDWRLWERYFAEKLLDYDEAVNLWNWQWGASVGADPKPLRIFSPLIQSEKFDSQAKYIRKYIPELQDTETKHIHNPLKYPLSYTPLLVDHSIVQAETKLMYKQSSIDFEEAQKK